MSARFVKTGITMIHNPKYCETCNSKLAVQKTEVVFPSVLILHCSRMTDLIEVGNFRIE